MIASMTMVNFRLKHDWSPGEVLLREAPHTNRLRYRIAMERADEIINKMMRPK
jgi:hypothetical protein